MLVDDLDVLQPYMLGMFMPSMFSGWMMKVSLLVSRKVDGEEVSGYQVNATFLLCNIVCLHASDPFSSARIKHFVFLLFRLLLLILSKASGVGLRHWAPDSHRKFLHIQHHLK